MRSVLNKPIVPGTLGYSSVSSPPVTHSPLVSLQNSSTSTLRSNVMQRVDRKQLLDFGLKLGIKEGDYDGWYKVRVKDLGGVGGMHLLSKYKKSLFQLLESVFSEHDWDISKFLKKPQNYWSSDDNQREMLFEVGKKLGIKDGDYDAWYKVRLKDLAEHNAMALLEKYGKSLSKILIAIFPDHKWDVGRFSKRPQGYWKSPRNQREFLVKLGESLGIKSGEYEGWYKVQLKDFKPMGGLPLVMKFGKSISKLLASVFPEHPWDNAKFHKKPQKFWESKQNQRKQLLLYGEKLGLKQGDYEGWYQVSAKSLGSVGGRGLLYLHRDSPYRMLKSILSEHPWDPAKFPKKPHHHWDSTENHRKVLLEFAKRQGFAEGDFEAWYNVSMSTLSRHVTDIVLRKYNFSPFKLLSNTFPEHKWIEAKFERRPGNYWESKENQLSFLNEISKEFGIGEQMEEWYSIGTADFLKMGGAGLLQLYGGSARAVIMSLLPEHQWHPWRFSNQTSYSFWKDSETLKMAANTLESLMGISDREGWYRVSSKSLRQAGLHRLLGQEAHLFKFLSLVYPDHSWNQDSINLSDNAKT